MICKDVIARKDHTCTYCGDTIKKGDFYGYFETKEPTYAEDGMGNHWQDGIIYLRDRTCVKCQREQRDPEQNGGAK